MQSYQVISAFKYQGELIEPPCDWTPPDEEIAKKLIAADCLRPAPNNATSKAQRRGRKQT